MLHMYTIMSALKWTFVIDTLFHRQGCHLSLQPGRAECIVDLRACTGSLWHQHVDNDSTRFTWRSLSTRHSTTSISSILTISTIMAFITSMLGQLKRLLLLLTVFLSSSLQLCNSYPCCRVQTSTCTLHVSW